MASRSTHEPIRYQWKSWKDDDLVEHYGHPSPLARNLWLHLIGIGKSRCKPGYFMPRAGNRVGHVLHYLHRGEMWQRINDKMVRLEERSVCLVDLSRKFTQGNDTPRTADLWWIGFVFESA